MDKSEVVKSQDLYDKWAEIKKEIDLKDNKKFLHIKTKEVWYVNLGKNIGFESNGKDLNFKRPVLVLKIIGALVFIVTMTTKGKNSKFYHKLNNKYFNKDSFLTLSQIKSIDKKRFINKIGKIDTDEFIEVKEKLKQFLL